MDKVCIQSSAEEILEVVNISENSDFANTIQEFSGVSKLLVLLSKFDALSILTMAKKGLEADATTYSKVKGKSCNRCYF